MMVWNQHKLGKYPNPGIHYRARVTFNK
jgi:hypothetical protein